MVTGLYGDADGFLHPLFETVDVGAGAPATGFAWSGSVGAELRVRRALSLFAETGALGVHLKRDDVLVVPVRAGLSLRSAGYRPGTWGPPPGGSAVAGDVPGLGGAPSVTFAGLVCNCDGGRCPREFPRRGRVTPACAVVGGPMSTLAFAEPSRPNRPVAPARHTLFLLAILAAIAVSGAIFQQGGDTRHAAGARPSALGIYLPLLLSEWAMFLYVWKRGLKAGGTSLDDIVGGRWRRPAHVLRDLALGVGVWAAWAAVEYAWTRFLGAGHSRSIAEYLPRGAAESVVWVALSLSAGFVEEVVYRGYLQRQFAAWTGSVPLGLLLQAIVFGVSHGYQGVDACLRITAYALLFGGVAMWRRSLRPGMMAHALTDVLAGLFRI